jgi:hypothetical protein
MISEVRMLRGPLMLLALFLASSCTTPPLETRATERPRYTVIPTSTSAARTAGIAPIARIDGSSSSDLDAVSLDGGALTFVFSGTDQHLHLGRVFPQGDLQDLPLEVAAHHSPWGLGLAVGPDGSRWVGLYRSVIRIRPDRTFEELLIPTFRPPGLAAEGGRNGEVTTIAVDDAALYIGRAGIPALTRLDLASGRTVALPLPADMPDVARIARGPGGDFFFAANQHSSPSATESTARFRRANGQVEALPYRGRRLVANSTWVAVATPDVRFLDATLNESRAPVPAGQVGPFDILASGELVTLDPTDAAVVTYDLGGRVMRRVPIQVRLIDGRIDRLPQFIVADGNAVWVVWGLDVFYVR